MTGRQENPPPSEFSEEEYIKWHEERFPDDANLVNRIRELRVDLQNDASEALTMLGDLLELLAVQSQQEVSLRTNALMKGKYDLPSRRITQRSEDLFKPVNSILEKLWRKNSDAREPSITMNNIRSRMTDLIRTSVVSPTLYHAHDFARRLENWHAAVDLNEKDFGEIERVHVDPEAKLASGYFAYHSLVHFRDDTVIEVQVFSKLTAAWRTVSHRLYELARIGEEVDARPGTWDARLASLGHLLHLADCELERLVEEFVKGAK